MPPRLPYCAAGGAANQAMTLALLALHDDLHRLNIQLRDHLLPIPRERLAPIERATQPFIPMDRWHAEWRPVPGEVHEIQTGRVVVALTYMSEILQRTSVLAKGSNKLGPILEVVQSRNPIGKNWGQVSSPQVRGSNCRPHLLATPPLVLV